MLYDQSGVVLTVIKGTIGSVIRMVAENTPYVVVDGAPCFVLLAMCCVVVGRRIETVNIEFFF